MSTGAGDDINIVGRFATKKHLASTKFPVGCEMWRRCWKAHVFAPLQARPNGLHIIYNKAKNYPLCTMTSHISWEKSRGKRDLHVRAQDRGSAAAARTNALKVLGGAPADTSNWPELIRAAWVWLAGWFEDPTGKTYTRVLVRRLDINGSCPANTDSCIA